MLVTFLAAGLCRRWIWQAAYRRFDVPAAVFATVAVNSFVFKQPVFVGDLVSLYADVIRVGHTSVTVNVAVYVQRGVREGERKFASK